MTHVILLLLENNATLRMHSVPFLSIKRGGGDSLMEISHFRYALLLQYCIKKKEGRIKKQVKWHWISTVQLGNVLQIHHLLESKMVIQTNYILKGNK